MREQLNWKIQNGIRPREMLIKNIRYPRKQPKPVRWTTRLYVWLPLGLAAALAAWIAKEAFRW